MNQAEAQNDARPNWFQNARERQTRDQGNSVFDGINRLNEHNPTNVRGDQNQDPRGQEPQYSRNAAPQNLGASLHSLTEQMNNMHMDLAAHPIQPHQLSMLPQQQQQVKKLKDNLSVAHVDLKTRKLHINLFEAINQKLNLGLDDDLAHPPPTSHAAGRRKAPSPKGRQLGLQIHGRIRNAKNCAATPRIQKRNKPSG